MVTSYLCLYVLTIPPPSVDCFYSMMSETCPSPESAWILHSLRTLLKLVTDPCDQIGPTELDRIKGFSGHLFGEFDIFAFKKF